MNLDMKGVECLLLQGKRKQTVVQIQSQKQLSTPLNPGCINEVWGMMRWIIFLFLYGWSYYFFRYWCSIWWDVGDNVIQLLTVSYSIYLVQTSFSTYWEKSLSLFTFLVSLHCLDFEISKVSCYLLGDMLYNQGLATNFVDCYHVRAREGTESLLNGILFCKDVVTIIGRCAFTFRSIDSSCGGVLDVLVEIIMRCCTFVVVSHFGWWRHWSVSSGYFFEADCNYWGGFLLVGSVVNLNFISVLLLNKILVALYRRK